MYLFDVLRARTLILIVANLSSMTERTPLLFSDLEAKHSLEKLNIQLNAGKNHLSTKQIIGGCNI